jgi:signal transduction histidine kinase
MEFLKKANLSDFFKGINYLRSIPALPAPYDTIWRYFCAFITIVLAVLCNLHIHVLHIYPTLLLFASVIFSAWYGGLGPGFLAIILAILSFDYFFTPPIYAFSFDSTYIPQSIVFISVALLISSLVESQRQAEIAVSKVVEKQRRFIADASHELFTPLSVIRTQSEVTLQSPNADTLTYKDVTAENIEEVDHMTKIVENLLELSRGEFRAREKLATPVELSTLLEEVIRRMKILAVDKKIILSLSSNDTGKIIGDATALTHMLINLVQNSIQYTPQGGKVSAGVYGQGKMLQVIIRDTGIGISPEQLPFIFDPFYKVDEARMRRHGGAGLGLAIVKSVVDNHKGKIKVESKINSGTAITVEFSKLNL